MALTKKEREQAFQKVFIDQVPDHAKSRLNSGTNYKRPYNKTKRAKGLA